MGERDDRGPQLARYQFPARAAGGLLFGLSAGRLAAIAAAGGVFVAAMAHPSPGRAAVALVSIGALAAAAAVRVAGRPAVDWLPIWVGYGWARLSGNHTFHPAPAVGLPPLPEPILDLPGGLFGIELHQLTPPTAARPADADGRYGIVADTFRRRLVAIAELSGQGFLFGDLDDQQARIGAWGAVLDHVAQSLPELTRLQLVHTAGPADLRPAAAHHASQGGRGSPATADSYRRLLTAAAAAGQDHRLWLAVGLDEKAARRTIRAAGGGLDGGAQVLLDRAATLEDSLTGAGLTVHGWLDAGAIGRLLRDAFDPTSTHAPTPHPDRNRDGDGDPDGDGGVPAGAAGPWGMVDGWSALRHDSGWSATLQVARLPARPVTGDFLQHLLVGVPARRRWSLLWVPTPMAQAERRAQSLQVTQDSEQAIRARLGFAPAARQRATRDDAARREADLVAGRTVYRLVWLCTVTAADPTALETAVAQVEASARRAGLELRRLSGLQRHAFGWTLPLCRGAR